MGGVSGGGKGGGSMPQQQTPPSPGVGNAATGQPPPQYDAMRNSLMTAQQNAAGAKPDMMRQQMMAMRNRNRPTGPVMGQEYSFGTPPAPDQAAASPATAAPLAAAAPPPTGGQQLPGSMPGGGQFADQAAANMYRQQNGMRGWGNMGGMAQRMGGIGSLMPGQTPGQPPTQQGMQQWNDRLQQFRGLGSLLGGVGGFAEGGPVAAKAQGWVPTGAGISPGTPSGPVVWNPNRSGGAPPTGGVAPIARLPAIVAQKPGTGVVKYAPPVVAAAKTTNNGPPAGMVRYTGNPQAPLNSVYLGDNGKLPTYADPNTAYFLGNRPARRSDTGGHGFGDHAGKGLGGGFGGQSGW